MKPRILQCALLLAFVASAFSLPLTVVIFNQSAELAKKVTSWNKQCAEKPNYDEDCLKKRKAISAELGQFVALVNDELAALRDISPDASADFVRQAADRRKVMELESRNALYVIKCLGVPASDPQCSAESAAIEQERASLQNEYAQTHAVFDGQWISLRATVSPAPKKIAVPSSETRNVATTSEESVASGMSMARGEEQAFEWRKVIKPEHIERVESAEGLASAFNSNRLPNIPIAGGENEGDRALLFSLLKLQDCPFNKTNLLGKWRCRTIYVEDLGVFVYPFFECRFIQKGGKLLFRKTSGSWRRSGYLYPDNGSCMVFLGSNSVNDDINNGEYKDSAGLLLKKGPNHFLFIFDASQKGYEINEIVK